MGYRSGDIRTSHREFLHKLFCKLGDELEFFSFYSQVLSLEGIWLCDRFSTTNNQMRIGLSEPTTMQVFLLSYLYFSVTCLAWARAIAK